MGRNQSAKTKKEKLSSSIPASKEGQKKAVKPKREIMPFLPYFTIAVFAIVAYVALLTDQSDYLFRSQELSLFLPSKGFFQQQMVVPGGFITWLGAWFTQFFYYPWLGILLLVALWVLIYGLSLSLFKVSRHWALLGLIAPLALMATVTNLGYWLFHLKSLGYMYSNTLGFLFALLLLWGYRLMPSGFRICWIFIAVAFGYPLIGAYALMAGIYMLVWALKAEKTNFQRIVQPLTALLVVGVAPIIWYSIYTQINFKYIYLAVLPYFIEPDADFMQWVPLLILFLSLFPLLLLGGGASAGKDKRKPFYLQFKVIYAGIQLVLLVAFLYTAKVFWYNDSNFRAELFMDQAAKAGNWDAVIERAYKEQGEPTRLMVMIKNLALLRQGRGGDEMFRFPDGGARPNAKFEERMMQVGGKLIYFNYAKLNFCYRWCLEDAVEYGMKVEYLKYMARCAIFSGDKLVARKYLRTLKQTRFHADWAEEQEKLLNDPALLKKDPLYEDVMAMYGYMDRLDGDQNLAEIYLLNYFANTWSAEPLYQEMSMMCTLIMKDIPLFWPRFFSYAQTHQRIPVHYQEAAALYCYLEREYDPATLPIDDEVKMRLQAFQNLIAQNPGRSEESLKPLFKSQFGDTFWFFYFFVRNVKSN